MKRIAKDKIFPVKFNTVPNFCRWRTYVLRLPWARGELDRSTWLAALRAAALGIPEDVIFDVLCRLIERAGDTVKADKVGSQIERAADYVRDPNRAATPKPPAGATKKALRMVVPRLPRPQRTKGVTAQFDPAALASYVAKHSVAGDPEVFITDRSPCRPDYLGSTDVLALIYQPGEMVLIFEVMQSQGQALWDHDMYPGQIVPSTGPDGVWFLANPVDGERHPNPRLGGKLSRRSEESVMSFRYAVLESDKADAAQWLTLLINLRLRIVAIYTSGGRSIHALVQIDATSKADWDARVAKFKPDLVRLGADPAALTAVRLSRLPQAWRGDRQQRLIYLNAYADGTPIRDQAVRPASDECAQRVWTMRNQGLPISAEVARASLAAMAGHHEDPWPATVIAHLEFVANGGAL